MVAASGSSDKSKPGRRACLRLWNRGAKREKCTQLYFGGGFAKLSAMSPQGFSSAPGTGSVGSGTEPPLVALDGSPESLGAVYRYLKRLDAAGALSVAQWLNSIVALRSATEPNDSGPVRIALENLQAANEELRACNEELRLHGEETAAQREELRASNVELLEANHVLHRSVRELGRANGDLETLLTSMNIATVFLDPALRILRFTPAAGSVLHLRPGDVGRPLTDLNTLSDYPTFPDDAARVLAHLGSTEREIQARDGSRHLARLSPYCTSENRLAGLVFTLVDVTARWEAEEARRKTEARLNAFVQRSSAGIGETDATGRFIAVNARFCELAGRPEAELLTLRIKDITHPDDWPRNRQLIEEFWQGGGQSYLIEKRFLRPDGTVVWVQNSVSGSWDAAGQIESCFAVCVDVTERRAAEAALGRSEARFRMFIESVSDYGVLFLDSQGGVTSWNAGAERIKGYTAEEVIGQPHAIFYPPEQRAADLPARDLAHARAMGHYEGEDWRMRKDGSLFWSEELILPLPDLPGEEPGFGVICRDLTTQRAADQERARLLSAEQAARREAEEANRVKDRFLASLSHELRTPLTPLQLALFSLRREKRLTAGGRELLAMMARGLETEIRLIDDLLDISRITHGKLDLQRAPLDLHACLFDTLEVCRGDFDTRGLQLTVDLAASRAGISGDAHRLQQVFWNLFKNAAKFTPAEGQVTVRSRDSGDTHLEIEVIDTGVGMNPASLAKIFDAFEQGSAEVTHRFGGLGLGLAISQAIVEAHGGQLLAASEGINRGATFTVRLPLALG